MFLALHAPPFSHVLLIINSPPIGIMPGQSHFGDCSSVYNDISRANHSRRPNAQLCRDLHAFATGELHAQRPNAPGEEATISSLIAEHPPPEPPLHAARPAHAERPHAAQLFLMFANLMRLGTLVQLDAAKEDHPYLWRPFAGELARKYCTLGEREKVVKWTWNPMEATMANHGEEVDWTAVADRLEKTESRVGGKG
ncbi:hypothetical protein FA95DRAFT_1603795 [Auriscalpium vulgare]|uniref:Uncharacterized protein n=1 Tax=Auriscalpium vulgare TaxID=40419 RepID=A0ACB8S2M1_9AGAM|nr:hypothetical protein FA95DRAFT_1603795 [Auriscalpium vulgare]